MVTGPQAQCEVIYDVAFNHNYCNGFLFMQVLTHGIEWIMFHDHLDYFQKPHLGGGPNAKPEDHGTPNAHNH
jgi:hypothetical protein